jgi:hypothetical protein
VVLALAALTVVLLALSAGGFSRLAAESHSGEARLTASHPAQPGDVRLQPDRRARHRLPRRPTLSGETESGIALAVLPAIRRRLPAGKWLGAGRLRARVRGPGRARQCLVVRATVATGAEPATALALLAAQTTVLLTLAVLLSTAISPMASGCVAVGLFCTTWVAGVVGGVGASLGNDAVERVGTVSRMLLPTDGLWRGAMHGFQDPSALVEMGGDGAARFPFLSVAPLTAHLPGVAAVWL